MKSLSVALTIVGLMASSAYGADLSRPLPVKAPEHVAPTWTGFYIGGHGGWATGKAEGDLGYNDPSFPGVSAADVFSPVHRSINVDGFLAGGQVGFNWQAPGSSWIFGVEGDGSWADINGSGKFSANLNPDGNPIWNTDVKVKWLSTVRGRLGYALTDTLMAYGTGGVAFGGSSGHNSVVYDPPGIELARGDADATHVGWTAGAGLEWMLGQHWSIKAEYLYVDLGKENLNFVGTQDNAPIVYRTDSFSPEFKLHVFRGGLNFRF